LIGLLVYGKQDKCGHTGTELSSDGQGLVEKINFIDNDTSDMVQ
jgi:hypothetical protein